MNIVVGVLVLIGCSIAMFIMFITLDFCRLQVMKLILKLKEPILGEK